MISTKVFPQWEINGWKKFLSHKEIVDFRFWQRDKFTSQLLLALERWYKSRGCHIVMRIRLRMREQVRFVIKSGLMKEKRQDICVYEHCTLQRLLFEEIWLSKAPVKKNFSSFIIHDKFALFPQCISLNCDFFLYSLKIFQFFCDNADIENILLKIYIQQFRDSYKHLGQKKI